MGREILLKGDTINGKFLYEIEDVSGTGASCIVYKARYYDDKKQSHLVQIKEFYPYNLEICRGKNSNNLICTDIEQFESEKCRFISNAKKLASFNNDEATNSGTPFQVEIFETNQTAYSVVAYDAGDIYNEEDLQTMELTKVLEIIKNLARAVEFLHKNVYVHLDIKPENFLVDNTERVTLFDVDSIVLCDDINSENAHNISYTKKWAAPEVKQAAKKSDYKDISCKSDIFSIGVILFEAIMGRDFLPMETVSYNRNWDVENSIKAREEKQNRKVNISPKFYHHLKEIFEKTLDRNPNNRYENLEELKAALGDAKTLYNEKMFLLSNCPIATTDFVGRKDEIKKINGALSENTNVFLSGMGGIGKTELARKYAKIHKDDYDTIVYLKYTGDLKTLIKDIKICGYTESSAEESNGKIDELKKLLNERTLLIIDNFDISNDEKDEYLSCLLSEYNCKKLITTRNDFPQQKNAVQIKIGELSKSEAKELFLINYEKEMSEKDEKALESVLRRVEYLTLCIPILAQQCNESDIGVSELEEKLSVGMSELDYMEDITVYKDDDTVEDTIPQYLRAIFKMADLNNERKKVLSNLSLLQFIYVTKKDYKNIALYKVDVPERHKREMDVLNSLVKQNWVKKIAENNEIYYELHSMINELVKYYLKPNAKDNYEVFEYMADFFNKRRESRYGKILLPGDLLFDDFMSDWKYFTLFMENIDLTINENYAFLADMSKKCHINKYGIAKRVLKILLKKDLYEDADIHIIFNYVLDAGFMKKEMCKQVLSICYESYQKGSVDRNYFEDAIIKHMEITVKHRVGNRIFDEKGTKNLKKNIWTELCSTYLDTIYEKQPHQDTSDYSDSVKQISIDEFNRALILAKKDIAVHKEIDPETIRTVVDYIADSDDETVANEVVMLVIDNIKGQGCKYYCEEILDYCYRRISLDFDVCRRLVENIIWGTSEIPQSFKNQFDVFVRAIAHLILGNIDMFLENYRIALEKLKDSDKGMWAKKNTTMLQAMREIKLNGRCAADRRTSQSDVIKFIDITASYIYDLETHFNEFPEFEKIYELWLDSICKCLRYGADNERYKIYKQKYEKIRGKRIGLRLKSH